MKSFLTLGREQPFWGFGGREEARDRRRTTLGEEGSRTCNGGHRERCEGRPWRRQRRPEGQRAGEGTSDGTGLRESAGLFLALMTDHVSMRSLVDGNQSHRGKDARADRECNAKPRDDGQWNQGGRLWCFIWRTAVTHVAVRGLVEMVNWPLECRHRKQKAKF